MLRKDIMKKNFIDDIVIKKESSQLYSVFKAILDGKEIGYIFIINHNDSKTGESKYWELYRFKIHFKEFKGVGIGKKLFDAVIHDSIIKKRPLLVKPEPYKSDFTPLNKLRDMYKHLGFRDFEGNSKYLIFDKS